jgi:hypothetical protein
MLSNEERERLAEMCEDSERDAEQGAREALERIAKAVAAHEADPIDNRDRPSSWQKLSELREVINEGVPILRAALAHRESPVTSGERAALRIAARLVDDLNGEDIHGVAWEMCMKRLGVDEDFDADPNDDDYAAALVDICSRIPTEAP